MSAGNVYQIDQCKVGNCQVAGGIDAVDRAVQCVQRQLATLDLHIGSAVDHKSSSTRALTSVGSVDVCAIKGQLACGFDNGFYTAGAYLQQLQLTVVQGGVGGAAHHTGLNGGVKFGFDGGIAVNGNRQSALAVNLDCVVVTDSAFLAELLQISIMQSQHSGRLGVIQLDVPFGGICSQLANAGDNTITIGLGVVNLTCGNFPVEIVQNAISAAI